VRDFNRLYRSVPALHARDCEPEGFQWIVVDDINQSVLAWLRLGDAGDAPVAIACDFTPVPRVEYRVGLPFPGAWREVMNTDASVFGGSGLGDLGCAEPTAHPSHGMLASATMLLPPLSAVYFQFEPG
jgi:1,4-alpha-glucan branching enzyme